MKTTQLHGTAVFITPVSCEKERDGIMLELIIKVTDKQIAASTLLLDRELPFSKYTSKHIVTFIIIISLFARCRIFFINSPLLENIKLEKR